MSWFKPRDGGRTARAAMARHRGVVYSSSPLLASKTPPWRSKFLVALVGLGFVVLLGRAVYVQIAGAEFFQKQGEIRFARKLELPASRGRILDRNGQILAASVPAPSLWVLPKDFEASSAQRRALARLLGMTSGDLDKRLDDNPNFIWLRRQVDEQVARDAMALKLPGLHQVREYKRKYPEGESSAHVVGFTNAEERGQEGVELSFDAQLAGRDGMRRVIKDRLGRVVEDIGDSVAPVDGRDLTLAIDSKVQFFAYQRVRDAVAVHKAKAGSVVVLDVQSGGVLALANYPSYTPGDRHSLNREQMRNRALTDTFEPGSTMKPFIASWALETRRVKPDTLLATAGGRIKISGKTITDAHAYGDLTVAQVIQKSSNVGTVRMAMQMQPKEMYDLFTSVGFGQRPQIGFPGVVSGRVRPYKTWKPIEQATMSYGYGVSVSLFQIARAYTVFARDGELIPVTMSRHPDPVTGTRVLSEKTAQTMRGMLQTVADEGGTAPKARTPGYSVGGKSGTAYKQEGKTYARNKYRAWFVGLAPIKNPRIVVAVLIDEPTAGSHFGGDVAGPVFSKLVQQTLRQLSVQPDLDVRTQIVAKDVPAVEESF